MSVRVDQESNTDDIDEDEILAGLTAEELKQLEKEMDEILPDERVPRPRQKDSSQQSTVRDSSGPEEDIDEDKILASLTAEELKQLQSEMEEIAPDEGVQLKTRQKD